MSASGSDQIDALIRRIAALESRLDGLRLPEVPGVVSAWTPTLWQNGVQISSTASHANYIRVGGLCFVDARVSATAASAGSGLIEIRGLPYTAKDNNAAGSFVLFQSSHYEGATRMTASNASVYFTVHGSTSDLGVNPVLTLANGSTFRFFALFAILE